MTRGLTAALTRYRVIAWIVGVALLVLVLVGMPMKYLGDEPLVVAVVGPIHGWLYVAYLVLTFDLGRRAGWRPGRIIPMMLAGTIPFLSFYAERKATAWIQNARRRSRSCGGSNQDKNPPQLLDRGR